MRASTELEDLIAGYFNAFTAGDVEWVDRHVSRDPALRLIGTDPSEWLRGGAGFELFRREAASANGALTAELSEIEAYRDGAVGWGAVLVEFTNRAGAIARARFSVVFRVEGDEWRMVSSHTSVAVPDADVFRP